MSRAALLAAIVTLVGCGFLQVGERSIPPVAGTVATTEWESQDIGDVTSEEVAGLTTPEAYLAFIIRFAEENGSQGLRSGVLSRDGDEALAYLQQANPLDGRPELLANEARLTLQRKADGSWTLAALETREACGVPLTDGSCRDNPG